MIIFKLLIKYLEVLNKNFKKCRTHMKCDWNDSEPKINNLSENLKKLN